MLRMVPQPIFEDRRDAGRRLGRALSHLRDRSPLVLGLARGGVIVAVEVAAQLDAELDVLVVRKLGAPQNPEVAIGAVTAEGGLFLDEDSIRMLRVSREYLDQEIRKQRQLAHERERRYRQGRARPVVAGRTVVLVDDGMATGASMIAAARSVREDARHLILAAPVGAPSTCAELRAEADEVLCLYQPDPFWAVGLFYRDFSEVTDAEVVQALNERVAGRAPSEPARPER
jgi:putative phosphoribosyl transferase